jgi:CheY-like chemotaxis protein
MSEEDLEKDTLRMGPVPPPSLQETLLAGGGATHPAPRGRPRAPIGTGSVLDQKYAVGPVIGSGAMGTVFEGRHVLLGREVAIKAIVRVVDDDGLAQQARMLAEGRVMASIAHPHVVQVHDLGILEGAVYLVMERLRGETLEARIARAGILPVQDAVVVARQILSGLGAVHRHGIAHRDLKPANVFLVAAGDGVPHAKILDFGVSTAILPGAGPGDRRIVGTPAFLSPEQVLGEAIDARADLWALGVSLYQMLTGRLPFETGSFDALMGEIVTRDPPPPSALQGGIGPALDRVVMRALAKRREDRFPDAAAMLAALSPLGGEQAEIVVEAPQDLALVADADPHVAEGLGAIARRLGLAPILAGDGAEARELVASVGAPRLLLTNLSLPREDGFALIRALRAAAGGEETRVVALSPVPDLRAAARALHADLGLAAVIDTALAPEVIHDVVRRVLAPGGRGPLEAPPEAPRRPELSEASRLDRIARMKLVDDRPADSALQRLVDETARAMGVPVAMISLILQDRQWFKAHIGVTGRGLEERGTHIAWAFCRHVAESGAPLVVPDARAHPMFAANPLVADGTVGSYCGAPLVTPTGEVLGTLCIIDHERRPIGRDKVDDMVLLARRVAGELEIRGEARPPEERRPSTTQHRLMAVLANLDSAVLLLDEARTIVFVNEALAALASAPPEALLGKTRGAFVGMLAPIFDDPADYVRRVRVLDDGPFAGREDFVASRPSRRVLRWSAKPVEMKDGLGQLETYTELPLAV